MAFQIEITPTAFDALKAVSDKRTRDVIMRRIDTLGHDPEKQGKPLRGWLSGFFSVRAAGQRYRIIYTIDTVKQRVVIYLAGIRKEGSRKDIYTLAERLVQRGLLEEAANDFNQRNKRTDNG